MSNESRWRRASGSHFVIDPLPTERPAATSATGSMGAAPAVPEAPRLLGPDGNPLPGPEPLPFGFIA